MPKFQVANADDHDEMELSGHSSGIIKSKIYLKWSKANMSWTII